jgi:hypothetical protein
MPPKGYKRRSGYKNRKVFPVRCARCGAKITYENVYYRMRGAEFIGVFKWCLDCQAKANRNSRKNAKKTAFKKRMGE